RHEFAAPEDLWDWLESEGGLRQAVVLPVYLYDHSGLRMSVRPFGDPWDSGQVGWIVAPASRIREEYRVKRIGPRIRREVEDILRGEVEVYDLWLRGEVYGYQLYRRARRGFELVDSCWGFYGYRPGESSMLDHLPRPVGRALVREVSCLYDGLTLVVSRSGARVLEGGGPVCLLEGVAL
ncbi:MAG: hypothetical protein H5T97_06535, partial [Firmicutes bacterium]|nr:hypothetical protein [Bacillota bacterium]